MERPAKRARQACEPCRRKKSKCPGEKPVCSYCTRLGQQCSYSDDVYHRRESNHGTENASFAPYTHPNQSQMRTPHTQTLLTNDTVARLNNVESQLAQVLSVLHQQQKQSNVNMEDNNSAYNMSPQPTTNSILRHESMGSDLDTAIANASLYAQYCHCQPLPLFEISEFSATLSSRAKELIFAIAALACRFQSAGSQSEQDEKILNFVESASTLVMGRIMSGTVELSTIQTLCVLALVEFYHSNTHRASLYISIAVDLAQNAALSSSCQVPCEGLLQEEQMRCFWSVVLLVRLHSNLTGAFSLAIDESQLGLYPASSPRPPLAIDVQLSTGEESRTLGDYKDLGIVAYGIQLADVWQRAAHYVRRRRLPESHPPWSSKSEYAKIIARQMDRETLMPYSKHRFKPSRFADRSSAELNEHREYWGPWLLNQMMYHATICVLNHPLLLSLRLRNFRIATIPEIWLQHSDDLVSSHTKWIIHLIELVEAKSFLISDPFLAHFAAIVATIYLQQSFVDDAEVQQTKKQGYQTCLRFCQQVGQFWPSIKQLSDKLQELEGIVSESYRNAASSSPQGRVYIDLTTFWEILESSLISEEKDGRGLVFGKSLRSRHRRSANAEELSAHPLPEPNRLTTASTSPNFYNGGNTNVLSNIPGSTIDNLNTSNDDFAVLAQSYFAQGQDFVGGLDDWWTLEQT